MTDAGPPPPPPGLAEELEARDRAVLWHPYAPMPGRERVHAVVGAEGVRLTLADGRVVVDGMASWWAAIHGYRHPVLDAAVAGQLGRMAHVMFGGLTHPGAVELAERLLAMAPPGMAAVFPSDSGSVAVEVAMKMAVQHWIGRGRPGKQRFVAPRGGYHGDTFATMAVCDPDGGMHHLFPGVLPRQLFADLPGPAWGAAAPDPAPLASMATLLERHAGEVAAVILEPVVQGAGGMRFHDPSYVRGVRALCDAHDVLLIADEIATGFGRTGARFACGHAGISPDIMTVGKALTGGYLSMAATLCTASVADAVSRAQPGALLHGPTFMGNPLACAAANASLGLLEAGAWQRDVARIEAGLTAGLAPARGLPGVADVRVLGAIGVLEAVSPLPMGPVQDALLERGVWLRPFGKLLYTMPPYVTDDADVARITAAMVDVARTLGPS